MKLRIIILITVLGWHLTAQTQDLRFTAYTVSDGLTNNAIRGIYQDANGFLWISTWEGLSKYDGHKFTNYTTDNGMPHSLVNDVTEISSGVMMVALNDGSVCVINKGKLSPIGEKKFILNKFFQTKNNGLIAVTDLSGLVRIKGTTITKPDPTDYSTLFGFLETKAGDYLGIADRNSVILFDRSLKPITKMPFAVYLTPNCILEDDKGNIWVGTDSGLKLFDVNSISGKVLKWSDLPPALRSTKLETISIYTSFQDHEKNLWFGTSEGLFKISPGGSLAIFTEKDGLPSKKIMALYADREKNLWIGTFAGLAKLAYSTIQNVKIPGEELQNYPYYLLSVNRDHFIVVTKDALYDFNKTTRQFKKVWNVKSGLFPGSALKRNGYSICTNGKVYDYDPSTYSFKEAFSLDIRGYFAAYRHEKMFIYGGGDGLDIVFDETHREHLLLGSRINNIIVDSKDRIWVGTWETGLFRLTVDFEKKLITKTEDLTAKANDTHIRTLFEDSRKNIWVGTRYNGLTLFPDGDTLRPMPHINHRTGLMSNWVYFITETETGDIWASTLGGVNKIVPEKTGYRAFNFSRINNYFATVGTMVPGYGNELWCNSDKGMFCITDNYMERMPPMRVTITRAQLGKSDINYAEEENPSPLKLKYYQNNSIFEFTAPGLINEKELMYSYRLMGSTDTTWTQPANTHSIYYANLKPGHYQFEVRMTGWNGDQGPITVFPFIIKTPVWQTTWFLLIAILGLAFLFYLIYRYRVRQILKLQQVRNSIATDLHDDIGSTLTNINILSQLSLSHLDKPNEAKQFLTKIKQQVQGSSEALDDIIWSVNSRHDAFPDTLARMRRYVGDVFDNTEIKYELAFEEMNGDLRLGMEQRRDLYLIYKELLNNVRKHAGASKVRIQVSYQDKKVSLTISDNGNGFNSEFSREGNGLRNLQSRTARWKGNVNIQSVQGKGTTITVKMPFANNST